MKIIPITEMLKRAEQGGYGVGSFSARNTYLIDAVLQAAENTGSPVIVQISANEFNWFQVSAKEFADRFYQVADRYQVEAVLHLDHTKELSIIRDAIDAGFTSVMIDASQKEFEENIRITKEVTDYAHAKGVAVEAELGKVGGKEDDLDGGEGGGYTVPSEAAEFVSATGIDSLAVAIGTAHGVYKVTPKLDVERLSEIRKAVSIPLVLHGTSGVPDEAVKECIRRGICKVNYATDLRIAFSNGVKEVLGAAPDTIDPKKYNACGRDKVKEYVMGKMEVCGSVGKA